MRILVTGATGFIGGHVLQPLRARGFEVHTLGRRRPADPTVIHHGADLLDPVAVRQAVAAARASHLLHLAWYVEPGRYWTAPQNLDWVAASLNLVRAFTAAEGERIVVAGSCAEYEWNGPALALGTPATLYGVAKDALRRLLEAAVPDRVAWGRVFLLYGPGEPPGRLVSGAIAALLAGQRFATSHGRQRRDVLHVADVAEAFAALAASTAAGSFDIGSGTAPPVRSVIEEVARHTGGALRIDWDAKPLPPSEPAVLQADPARLHAATGFVPAFDLARGIADTVACMRALV